MKKVLASLVLMVGLVGCSSTNAPLREGMDAGTRTIREQHKEWVKLLEGTPENPMGQKDKLPVLTHPQVEAALKAHQEYENLVNQDRARDKQSGGFLGLFGGSK